MRTSPERCRFLRNDGEVCGGEALLGVEGDGVSIIESQMTTEEGSCGVVPEIMATVNRHQH